MWVAVAALAALVLLISACVTPVPRTIHPPTPHPTSPPPTPTAAPVPVATPTPVPPAPTATPLPTPTAVAPTPTLAPTPSPAPTPGPVPAKTPEPELFLQVRAPVSGTTVPEAAVVVYGSTTPGASVTVAGQPATVDANGGFRGETELAPGVNTFEVVATNSAGDVESAEIVVTSLALEPLPFLLLVTIPRDQTIVTAPRQPVEGYTGSRAVVSVKGVSVAVDPFGAFSTIVTLEPGPNIIDVLATNDDGQVRSVVLAVIYRAPEN